MTYELPRDITPNVSELRIVDSEGNIQTLTAPTAEELARVGIRCLTDDEAEGILRNMRDPDPDLGPVTADQWKKQPPMI